MRSQTSGQPRIRIVTADDHAIFRDGLRRLLEAEAEFEVVGQSASGAEAIRLVTELAPDILLVDFALGDMTGVEVLRALVALKSPVKAILLTAGLDREEIVDAMTLGARGLVLKESATQLLYKCVRAVHEGEYWFGRDRVPDLVEALKRGKATPAPPPASTLTPRELQIVGAVVAGASNKDIARQFTVSEQTVKNHMSNIFDKVGVSNRLELALYAIHHKLVGRN
jgi:two-component system nitrate/nitrite response regulator NarL